MTILGFQEKSLEIEQKKAVALGQEILQYNNAVRSWISKNPGAAPAIHTSTDWLKPTTCGGLQSYEYLSCNFPSFSSASPHPFGQVRIQTSISNVAGKITATSIASPIYLNKVRSDLSGLSAISAASGSMGHTPSDASYKANPFDGTIAFSASNIAMHDVWLRTDGSNYMNNNITYNPAMPAVNRGINGVSRIQSLIGEALYLGEAFGATKATPAKVVVDANQSIYGTLIIENQGNVVDGVVLKKGDLKVTHGDIIAGDEVEGKMFIDADNNTFFIDPAGSTNVNDLKASLIEAVQKAKSPIYMDSDNNAMQLDMDKKSTLNEIHATGLISTDNFLHLKGLAVEGDYCSEPGLVGASVTGNILNCTNNIWTTPYRKYGLARIANLDDTEWPSFLACRTNSGTRDRVFQIQFKIPKNGRVKYINGGAYVIFNSNGNYSSGYYPGDCKNKKMADLILAGKAYF